MKTTYDQRISFRPHLADLAAIATIRDMTREDRGITLTVSDIIRESLRERARFLLDCQEACQ